MSENYYAIGTHTAEQFNEVHNELCNPGSSIEAIPVREVECTDHVEHSPTRGIFLLTDEEAELLKNDSRIQFINLDFKHNKDLYNVPEDDLLFENPTIYQRYEQAYENAQIWYGNGNFNTNALNRNTSQLLRLTEKVSPWLQNGNNDSTIIDSAIPTHGAGEDVDVIVCDNGCWFGHVEFINRGVTNAVNPVNYKGGNVLPGNGYCDLLDIVFDSPYYIDPEWFDADPTRLETRWDGTIVPTETAARAWWEQTNQRSPQFAEFGSIQIENLYTRTGNNGNNNSYPTTASGTHGTQCAGLTYGRTQGWAYNANKWHLNHIGGGRVDWDVGFDIQKIFHKYKPINPKYGTKDPTISSNSWGFRVDKSASYYFWRNDPAVAYTTEPEFIRYLGSAGDGGRWKSEMYDNSMTQAAKELVDEGVIYVCAAGNSNQQQVNPDHPNYDNHIGDNTNEGVYDNAWFSFGFAVTGTTNRRGFPQHIGKTESLTFQGNTTVKFPGINIGALDDLIPSSKEQKVNYSDMGNAIDFYAPADGTLAATVGTYGVDTARLDDNYTDLGTQDCRDTRFGGTSAACPVAAGFLSTVIQYNRNWTYEDLRSWIQSEVQTQSSTNFYIGSDPTGPEDTAWSDLNSLNGGPARVIYNANIPITTPLEKTLSVRGSFVFKNGLQLRRNG